jgi:hypothetical protein
MPKWIVISVFLELLLAVATPLMWLVATVRLQSEVEIGVYTSPVGPRPIVSVGYPENGESPIRRIA